MNRIPGTRYWATAEGDIVSPRGKVLSKKGIGGNGYIMNYVGGGRTSNVQPAHQLIARAFLGYPLPGQEVCHNDGNPLNNRVDNLRYGTPKDNAQDSLRHGTHARARQTHCKRGHLLAGDNLYRGRDGQGRRTCRECVGIRRKARATQ